MSAQVPLDVRLDRRPDAIVVVLRGELDLSTVEQLRTVLASLDVHGSTVIIDLRQLTFIDSSGLSVLVEVQRRADQDGYRLAVAVGGAAAVQRVIDLAGLRDTLTLVDGPEETG